MTRHQCCRRLRVRALGPRVSAGFGAVLSAAALLSVTPAYAAPENANAQCLEAYTEGQRARKRGAFNVAREALAFCGGSACPQALHSDCSRWLDELEAATPTSVFRVTDKRGRELDGAQVSVNGGPKQQLDGRSLTLDPGKHVLTFEREGYHSVEQSFTFSEGEKLVVREVRLRPAHSNIPATATGKRHIDGSGAVQQESSATLVPAWISAGVGAAGFAGFAYFGLSARADDQALDQCFPNCTVSRVEAVEQQYLWANVSLGVGVVGVLGAAAWLLFGADNSGPSVETPVADLTVYLGPTTGLVARF